MAAVVSSATAAVDIQIANLDSCIMELTYTIGAPSPTFGGAKREFTFPSDGFDFATGPLTVVKAFETESGKEVDWELVAAENNSKYEAVELHYAHTLPSGNGTATTIVVRAKTANIGKDPDGRYIIKYATGQLATFRVPTGHRLVYTNYPVTLYEKAGLTVAEVPATSTTERKELIFKTRAF